MKSNIPHDINTQQMGRRKLPTVIMAIYNKPTANITVNDERESFPSNIRNKVRMTALTTSFNTVLEVLA